MDAYHADGRTDTASRVIAASPQQVYAALVDASALEAWLPPAGMSGHFERFDLRAGGGYRMVLTYQRPQDATAAKSTEDADIVEVRFVELVPNVRIVQGVDFDSDDPAFGGTMTMTWHLDVVDGSTRVTIVAEHVPPGISAEDHSEGMNSTLDQLAAFVAT